MPEFEPQVFLRSLEVFARWSTEAAGGAALDDLATRVEVWAFSEHDLVRFPDEAPRGPGWVAEGCLVVDEGGQIRYIGVREALEAPRGAWVRGQSAGRLVVVPEAAWVAWFRAFPWAAERLGQPVPRPLPRSLRHSPLVLEPGETVLHLFRKSPVFLGMRALMPGVFLGLFLLFGLALQLRLGDQLGAATLWLIPGLGILLSGGALGLVTWEWSTSVLAVTDRAVLVRQVDLWARRSDFEKLAIDRIREAIFSRQGWADAVLGLVTLELEGDSPQGRLTFRGLPRSTGFLRVMEQLKIDRARVAPDRQTIRQALANRTGGARRPRLERPSDHEEVPPKKRLNWRKEDSSGVWFRRHPWFVLRRSLPWMGWTVLVVFLGCFAGAVWPQGWGPVASVTTVVALIPVGRIGWEFWNWAENRLSIQGDRILLIHRRPLWLGEVRQEGSLDQVQQVGVRKDSLAALLFDFGVVTVSLGASDPLVFEEASHPEWVQNEIFHRRSQWARKRERQEAQTRLDEVSEILDTWDEAQKAGYFKKDNP